MNNNHITGHLIAHVRHAEWADSLCMDDQLIHRESVDTEAIQYDPPLTI